MALMFSYFSLAVKICLWVQVILSLNKVKCSERVKQLAWFKAFQYILQYKDDRLSSLISEDFIGNGSTVEFSQHISTQLKVHEILNSWQTCFTYCSWDGNRSKFWGRERRQRTHKRPNWSANCTCNDNILFKKWKHSRWALIEKKI